ncbi:MAG: transglycosylase SLT domain-containing protein [Blastocatellia bacterium]
MSTVVLALLTASPTKGFDHKTTRTEARAKAARANFERLLDRYPEFLPELQKVAVRLETNPEWLLNVMASESSFIPSVRNPLPHQTASGLLQIIEGTAASLGTTTSAIRRMSAVEPVRIIEKFFTPFRGKLNSQGDVYLAVFRGIIIEGGPETVVAPLNNSSKERRAYYLNRGLDVNGNGRITKGELALTAFSVGRFGSSQQVAETRSQTVPPQQEVTLNSKADVPRSPVSSLYIMAPATNKPVPGTSSKESVRSQSAMPGTRSTYFP